MSDLDNAIQAFCEELTARRIDVSDCKVERWVREGNCISVKVVDDPRTRNSDIVLGLIGQLEELVSFRELVACFSNHSPFSTAVQRAGARGFPDAIARTMLAEAIDVRDGLLHVSPEKALAWVQECSETIESPELTYMVSARIMGLELTTSSLVLSPSLRIVRLTEAEINERQPTVREAGGYGMHMPEVAFDHAEARFELTIAVPDREEAPIVGADAAAQSKAKDNFDRLLSALRLHAGGVVALGPLKLHGGPMSISGMTWYGATTEVRFSKMKLSERDEVGLQQCWKIVCTARDEDELLDRALHRFLLGRERTDPIDKIIDYSIAWESLLLTTRGHELTGELSYRFSLNGASVISEACHDIDRHETFEKMKCCYSVRSKIVHGGSQDSIQRVTKRGGFESTSAMAWFLENQFRAVIRRLAELAPEDRPYRSEGGWLDLLWPRP